MAGRVDVPVMSKMARGGAQIAILPRGVILHVEAACSFSVPDSICGREHQLPCVCGDATIASALLIGRQLSCLKQSHDLITHSVKFCSSCVQRSDGFRYLDLLPHRAAGFLT